MSRQRCVFTACKLFMYCLPSMDHEVRLCAYLRNYALIQLGPASVAGRHQPCAFSCSQLKFSFPQLPVLGMSSDYEIALTYKVDNNSCRDIPSLRKNEQATSRLPPQPHSERLFWTFRTGVGLCRVSFFLQIALVWLALCVSSQAPP